MGSQHVFDWDRLENFLITRDRPVGNKATNAKVDYICKYILLRLESLSGMYAKLRTVAASINRIHPTRSLHYCLFMPYYSVVLHAHSIRGEPCFHRKASGEVATTSPPFCNTPHRSHVLCVKAAPGTTFTSSWSQQQFDAIRKSKLHVCKDSHCDSKQQ